MLTRRWTYVASILAVDGILVGIWPFLSKRPDVTQSVLIQLFCVAMILLICGVLILISRMRPWINLAAKQINRMSPFQGRLHGTATVTRDVNLRNNHLAHVCTFGSSNGAVRLS